MILMNDFEMLLSDVFEEVPVLEGSILEDGYAGLYRDGRIYLEKKLDTLEKKEVLAEEYCHHKTSVGDIINYEDFQNRKQEIKAWRMALEMLVPLDKLIECSFAGCTTKYDCADYLDVTVLTLEDALQHYTNKYGLVHLHKGYILHFNGDSAFVVNTGLQ